MGTLRKHYVGLIYESKNYGKFKIIHELKREEGKERRFLIEFLNTGYITDASITSIRGGDVRDYLVPSVANIGYIGYIDGYITDQNHYAYYKVWNDMMHRCYNVNDKDYPLYGGIGISVDPSWYCFDTFYNDIHYIPGYDLKVQFPDQYQLDKDYLQMNIPKNQRVYSKYTCMWLSKHDNTMIMQRDNPNLTGYFGVYYFRGSYQTIINNVVYGRFNNPEAAAYLFNVIYPLTIKDNIFANVQILNNVRNFTLEELKLCAINKNPFLSDLDMVQRLSERSTT